MSQVTVSTNVLCMHVFAVCKCFSVTQQGQAGFMDAALRELPTKSLEEVEQHEQWYTEYCTLLESKRKAIQAWKNQRKVSLMMIHVDSFSYRGVAVVLLRSSVCNVYSERSLGGGGRGGGGGQVMVVMNFI